MVEVRGRRRPSLETIVARTGGFEAPPFEARKLAPQDKRTTSHLNHRRVPDNIMETEN